MKRILGLVLALVLSLCASAQTTSILWLGNSYTTVNNLPQTFHDLALSGGDSVEFDSHAPGGYTLNQHSNDATAIQKIYSRDWDYVVIQAQSQEPSFPPFQVQSQTFPYAHKLDSLIKDNNPCTKVVFYMTWGRKYGDNMNCAGYPILCTFEGMQSRLRESYLQMADDNDALVAPAGMAWMRSRQNDSLIELWQGDYSHPIVTGTYLTACVFYGTIFQKPSLGLPYTPFSASPTTAFLQSVADTTVFDSLQQWNIGVFDPYANFAYDIDTANKAVSFLADINNATTYNWSFGDGEISAQLEPVHQYADTGLYTVTLIVADDCGLTDTATYSVYIPAGAQLPNSIHQVNADYIQLSPNPAKNTLTVKSTSVIQAVKIYDLQGKLVIVNKQPQTIDISTLQAGNYFVEVTTANGTSRQRLVKE
jgi:PKD repeat protein